MQRRIALAAVVLVLALGLIFTHSLVIEAGGNPGLVVKKVDTIPIIDGDPSDPQWRGTYAIVSDTTSWRAVYSDEEIALLLTIEDPTARMIVPDDWYYDAGEWKHWREYRQELGDPIYKTYKHVNMLWDIRPTGTGMAEGGCNYVCHDAPQSAQGARHGVPERASSGDSWTILNSHGFGPAYSFATGRNLGYHAFQEGPITFVGGDPRDPYKVGSGTLTFIGWADQRYWTYEGNPEFLGTAGTTETSRHCMNCHTAEFVETLSLQAKEGRMPYRLNGLDFPEYIELNPVDWADALSLTEIEIRNGQAVRIADLSQEELLAAWHKYEVLNALVPSWILQEPDGPAGTVAVAARWSDGLWTIEMKRALVTNDPLSVQFDDLDKDYFFTSAGGGFGRDAIRVTFER